MKKKFALVSPLANEEDTFTEFVSAIQDVLNDLETGEVYIFDDVIENETIFPYSLKLLIQLFSFMKNLKLDITFINNVIFDDLGINYLKNDERIQLKEEIEKI